MDQENAATRLFICHAFEDQGGFVRPLAEALSSEFSVWYSEYELTLGDSLRKKIDEGLALSDFGIVVLSKSFFGKQWTSAELDGLFALETASRKVILPVWLDVARADVAAFSPMLAGRMAVSAEMGLEKVVHEIRLAATVSERQRTVSAGLAAQQSVQALRQSVEDRKSSAALLLSERGAEIIWGNVQTLFDLIREALSVCNDPSSPIKFEITATPAKNPNELSVRTIHGMYLQLRAANMAPDWVREGHLEVRIFHRNWDEFGRPTSGLVDLHQEELSPKFLRQERLVWVEPYDERTYDTEQLANHAIGLFTKFIGEIDRERAG